MLCPRSVQLAFPGASVSGFHLLAPLLLSKLSYQASRKAQLSQEPNQPSNLSVILFPRRQFDKPAAQHFVLYVLFLFWFCLGFFVWLVFGCPFFLSLKNTSFAALIFVRLWVTFFLTCQKSWLHGRKWVSRMSQC